MSKKLLAIETSTDVCSVAFQNAEGELFEKRTQGRSVHSDHVFLFTQQLMAEHQFAIPELDAVLVSNGPGSYTGLRIAVSAIKGMLFGTDVEVIAVNTLAGFAGSLVEEDATHTIHAIIDARRTHVYHQVFWSEDELLFTKTKPEVKEIAVFEKELRIGHLVVGTGLNRISPESLQGVKLFGSENIAATHLLHLYNHQPAASFFTLVDLETLDPDYITINQVNNSAGA